MSISNQECNKGFEVLSFSQNKIKIRGGIYCPPCEYSTNRPTKRFNSCHSLYKHIALKHSELEMQQSLDALKKLSDLINAGVLK